MKQFFPLLGSLFLSLLFAGTASSDDLAEFILKQAKATSFSEWKEAVHDSYHGYILIDGEELLLDLNGAEKLFEELASSDYWEEMKNSLEISNFKILNRFDIGNFTSVSWGYDMAFTMNNERYSFSSPGASVLLKTNNSWLTLFDAENP